MDHLVKALAAIGHRIGKTALADDELAALNLSREAFHGEWNYTIKPHDTDHVICGRPLNSLLIHYVNFSPHLFQKTGMLLTFAGCQCREFRLAAKKPP